MVTGHLGVSWMLVLLMMLMTATLMIEHVAAHHTFVGRYGIDAIQIIFVAVPSDAFPPAAVVVVSVAIVVLLVAAACRSSSSWIVGASTTVVWTVVAALVAIVSMLNQTPFFFLRHVRISLVSLGNVASIGVTKWRFLFSIYIYSL